MIAILNSDAGQAAVLKLEGDEAQRFLDVIQTTLDRGYMITQEQSSMARKMIQKLSVLSNKLPSDLFINVAGYEEHPISGGTVSDIYKGSYDGQTVALKVMRTFHRGTALHAFRSKFYQDALIWQRLCHPNILPLLGIDRESFSPSVGMISPWMENGSVVQYFGKHGRGHVNKILIEIAQGLQYLHLHNIVHGDLRGANILINNEPRACLADFGLSFRSDVPLEHPPERAGGLRWMAPELIDPVSFGCQFSLTKASDVYAFGCVVLELYTGKPPFTHLSDVRAMFTIVGGKLPDRPTDTQPVITDALWELAIRCWGTNHATRPTIDKIVQDMSGIGDQPAAIESEKSPPQDPHQFMRWSTPTLSSTPTEESVSNCLCACTRPWIVPSRPYEVLRPINSNEEGRRTFHNGCSLGRGAAHTARRSTEPHHDPSFRSRGFNQSNNEKDAIQGTNVGNSLAEEESISASQTRPHLPGQLSDVEANTEMEGEFYSGPGHPENMRLDSRRDPRRRNVEPDSGQVQNSCSQISNNFYPAQDSHELL
ncbi:kinase-like domain-containing protein [Mycena epipterygia]|nr:kinase-like domain-containing protein [Mycena epipterygia]